MSEPVRSAGCGLTTPLEPGLTELPGTELLARVSLPSSYDSVTPFPLLFLLHATNQLSDIASLTAVDAVAERYVVVSPQASDSLGSSRSFESLAQTTSGQGGLDGALTSVLASLCVDERHVLGVGNGSGGRALMRWLSSREKAARSPRFRAVTIIGAYEGKVTWQPSPLLFLHATSSGISQNVTNDRDGMKAFAVFSAANACDSGGATPVPLEGCDVNGEAVNPGCEDIGDCAAPLRFCHFAGPTPSGGGDLWPCFGTRAIDDFFAPLLR